MYWEGAGLEYSKISIFPISRWWYFNKCNCIIKLFLMFKSYIHFFESWPSANIQFIITFTSILFNTTYLTNIPLSFLHKRLNPWNNHGPMISTSLSLHKWIPAYCLDSFTCRSSISLKPEISCRGRRWHVKEPSIKRSYAPSIGRYLWFFWYCNMSEKASMGCKTKLERNN